ncbi:hypothetical protein BV98_000817 [Sphingobium herbicidovorans NBRC 16415]|uniref:Uncharacterized protein n=1 Tax=Sphingobium herbicidovorans (strain ATCC 700291 / DSM 11019 / CCUG 56400 / KCTC 2939 / LMG 18315 / NBRC 16415 / MH) TaxID=1219045 RepID=A0A086PD58_SPHHM|nr:hypothetical protein [Sphingobium herbicidovorans]KFG91326.1 hypothetical protein BV98_000817 [Sphingobium herbicidovorans NBRC 16415]
MSGRPKWIYALAAVAAALTILLAWNWTSLRAQAAVGAGFGARVICSCRYVEGRSMDSCRGDKEPGMALVTLSDDPESRSIDASVPLLASRTARYRQGWGCLLDPVE